MKKPPEPQRAKVDRPYPRATLEQALRIPGVIKEKNAGNPWDPEQIAKALKLGFQTGNFYYLTAASRDFGLSKGSSKTEKIELTELGNRAVYPRDAEEEKAVKLEALLKVKPFRELLAYYKGSNLPEREYLSNVLRNEIGLDEAVHDEFVDLFQRNCKYLGIGSSFDIVSGSHGALQLHGGRDVVLTSPGAPADGPLCFIIMPFVEREERHSPGFFGEVLESLIVPAAKAAGFVARTANREGSDVIQSTIVNDLLAADLVVADLTEHNANVFFELGLRIREDKPVALIKAKGTGKVFDVDNMLRVFEYDPCLWPSTVDLDLPRLTSHIKGAWDNKDTGTSYMKLLRRGPVRPIEMERQY